MGDIKSELQKLYDFYSDQLLTDTVPFWFPRSFDLEQEGYLLMRDRDGSLVLERCGIEPLERGWVSEGTVEKFDEVADALRRLVQRTGSKTRNAALA